MKILSLIAAVFLLSSSSFAKCPDDLAGAYKGSGVDRFVIAVDAKSKVVTISMDGQSFSAPVTGVKTPTPAFGPTLSVELECLGEKLEQKSFDSDQPALEITVEYFLDKSGNLVSNNQTLRRYPEGVDCVNGGPQIRLERGCP